MASFAAIVPLVVATLVALLFLSGMANAWILLKGCLGLRRWRREAALPDRDVVLKSPLVPSVSVVAVVPQGYPDYVPFVRRLLALEFGNREVVVVLDGPSPRAVETWIDDFHLFQSYRVTGEPLTTRPVRAVYESRDPIQLVLLDKEAGGLGDALNAGLNASSAPYIALFDRESEFEQGSLLRLIAPILQAPQETLAVCGGAPTQSDGTLVGRFGELESLRAWLGRSIAFAGWNALIPAPGQTVIVQREAVVRAGGWLAGPVEMFLQLHGNARKTRQPYRIAFLPDTVSRSRSIAGMTELRSHISRDQAWLGSAIARLGSIPKGWGALGLWGVLTLFWGRLVRPLLETATYLLVVVAVVMHWIDMPLFVLALLTTVVGGMLISMSAVVLRELAEYRASDPSLLTSLVLAAIPENLGYRQVRNLWLIAGFFHRPS